MAFLGSGMLIIARTFKPLSSTLDVKQSFSTVKGPYQFYDFKKRYVDPMMTARRAAGKRGPDTFTNDAITFLFLRKAHSNLSYRYRYHAIVTYCHLLSCICSRNFFKFKLLIDSLIHHYNMLPVFRFNCMLG